MQIVSQDKSLAIPFNGARLAMKDAYRTQIIALAPDRQGKVVGEYGSYDRAKVILMDIIDNESMGERRVYYMPAE